MNPAGVIKRMDNLGRIVIPKQIRNSLRIKEGDPLEIYLEAEGQIILKKYSHMGELSHISKLYVEVLHKICEMPAAISDREQLVAISGKLAKKHVGNNITKDLFDLMESRRPLNRKESIKPFEYLDCKATTVQPILSSGNFAGAVLLLSGKNKKQSTEIDDKICKAAADFLAIQLE